jgi:hypothetical protein
LEDILEWNDWHKQLQAAQHRFAADHQFPSVKRTGGKPMQASRI